MRPALVATDGSLVRSDRESRWLASVAPLIVSRYKCGEVDIEIISDALSFRISDSRRTDLIQKLGIDPQAGSCLSATGIRRCSAWVKADRNSIVAVRSTRCAAAKAATSWDTHGGRVPIPWIIGTSGWAMFIHQPFGTFDFTGQKANFIPNLPTPLCHWIIFFVASTDPATIMAEYARLTGNPEMPPLWSFGYQQSHRTLASREEVLAEAKTFREKKLPCDALIYLGTGFCPSGWNTENGSFAWNSKVFPDPKTDS